MILASEVTEKMTFWNFVKNTIWIQKLHDIPSQRLEKKYSSRGDSIYENSVTGDGIISKVT